MNEIIKGAAGCSRRWGRWIMTGNLLTAPTPATASRAGILGRHCSTSSRTGSPRLRSQEAGLQDGGREAADREAGCQHRGRPAAQSLPTAHLRGNRRQCRLAALQKGTIRIFVLETLYYIGAN